MEDGGQGQGLAVLRRGEGKGQRGRGGEEERGGRGAGAGEQAVPGQECEGGEPRGRVGGVAVWVEGALVVEGGVEGGEAGRGAEGGFVGLEEGEKVDGIVAHFCVWRVGGKCMLGAR